LFLSTTKTFYSFVKTTTGKSRKELSEIYGFSEEQIAGRTCC